jgi:hypothetical protein
MSWHKLLTRTARPAVLRVVKPLVVKSVQTAVTGATASPLAGKVAGVAVEVLVRTVL